MLWYGKRSLTLRVRFKKAISLFYLEHQSYDKILSITAQAVPGPCSHLLLGWQPRGMQPSIERRTRTDGRSSDRLTDRLAHSYALSSTALRLSFEFNRIYKFYLCDMGAFCTPERAPWDESFQFPRRRSQMVRGNL